MTNHLGNVLTTISDRKIPQNPKSPFIYSTPDVVRTGIDSLGGMKIQPMTQYGGNHFTIPAVIGNNYKIDFYVNLANTNPDSVNGDWPAISYDANNANGYAYNDLYYTGHYTFTIPAPDTLFDFKILYYLQGSIPNHYLYFDSLQITEVGNTKDTIVAYTSDIRSVSQQSAFLAPLKDLTWHSGSYPNAGNGQRKDDEVYGAGNLNMAKYWEYDTRLARRWNIDPVTKMWQSPYLTFRNSPLIYIDPNGDDDFFDKNGNFLGSTKEGNNIRVVTKDVTFSKAIENIPNNTKLIADLRYCPEDRANRSMLSAIITFYGKDAGINETVDIGDPPKSKDGAMAFYSAKKNNFNFVASPETGEINPLSNDKNNVINTLVHEKNHKDDHSTWQPLGHIGAILTQVGEKSFEGTTEAYKGGIAGYAESLLNEAAKLGATPEQIQSKVDELNNSKLGNSAFFSYDKETNKVSKVVILAPVDVSAPKTEEKDGK